MGLCVNKYSVRNIEAVGKGASMNATRITETYLCEDCIQSLRSRGERVFISDNRIDETEAEEMGICCQFCNCDDVELIEVIW